MTEPGDPRNEPDLEQYLKGGSALSRRYRDASRETAPPELDAAILAQARAATRAPVRLRGGWGTGLALAASLMLAVNLGWNVWRAEPMPDEAAQSVAKPPPALLEAPPAERPPAPAAAAPAAPPADLGASGAAEPKRKLPTAQQRAMDAAASVKRGRQAAAEAQRKAEADTAGERLRDEEQRAAVAKESANVSAGGVAAPAAAARAPAPPPTEAQKIDRLIAFVGSLQGAVFIRNGDEHDTAKAVEHLQLKRRKAGDRVKTADDFIRRCASHSYVTKEAYLIRFPDGRTRTAEDVLREELARIESGQ